MTTSVIGIYAHAANGSFGNADELPWGRMFPTDLRWFRDITTRNPDAAILCGSGTFNSIPELKGRDVHVLTRDLNAEGLRGCWYKGYWTSLSSFFDHMREIKKDVIIIGGANVIAQTLPMMDLVFETTFLHDFEGDVKIAPLHPLDYVLLQTQVVRNLDDTKVDAIFNVWTSRKNRKNTSVELAKQKWGVGKPNSEFYKTVLGEK